MTTPSDWIDALPTKVVRCGPADLDQAVAYDAAMAAVEVPADLTFNSGPFVDPKATPDHAPFHESAELRTSVPTGLHELATSDANEPRS
jgi:hypothetical protein